MYIPPTLMSLVKPSSTHVWLLALHRHKTGALVGKRLYLRRRHTVPASSGTSSKISVNRIRQKRQIALYFFREPESLCAGQVPNVFGGLSYGLRYKCPRYNLRIGKYSRRNCRAEGIHRRPGIEANQRDGRDNRLWRMEGICLEEALLPKDCLSVGARLRRD
jgi:hypothetical protein